VGTSTDVYFAGHGHYAGLSFDQQFLERTP
jgi:hypothetical protein